VVAAAGGNQAVALRSGVPLGTVNNYLRGRNGMKVDPLAALAEACGVTCQWLITGDAGEARPLGERTPGLGEPPADPPPVPAARGIDPGLLAKAIEITLAVAGPDAPPDNPKELARRIVSAYAILTEPTRSG